MNSFENKININTLIAELDYLLSKNDYSGARDFLEKWVEIAQKQNDNKALFSLCNECIGLYRKIGEKESCYKYCEKALGLLKVLNIENTVTGATAYTNCATAYKAFGEAEKSISFFEEAVKLYERLLPENDPKLAGLYNNFALSLVDLKDFERALKLYEKAIDVLSHNPQFNLEQSVSYLNMANLYEAQDGLENACEKIDALLDKAQRVLDEKYSETDGNYAFVCEKCAPTFGYYGRFLYENELKERARVIYERS